MIKSTFYSFGLIVILISFITPTVALAQGPNSPEASSFEPVDATDMVNLITGDYTYVLPLLNVPSPEGGYPMAISYRSGIAVGQEASWVGLGWNINPGAINRYVSGVPDDWKGVRKFSSLFDAGGTVESYGGSISVGWGDGGNYSAGIYANHQTHKSVHGENSHRFDIGVTASFGHKESFWGVGGSLGTNGVGVNYSLHQKITGGVAEEVFGKRYGSSILSVGLSQSFIDGSTSMSLSNPALGTGISFSSKGGLSGTVMTANVGASGDSKSSRYSTDTRKIMLGIHLPLGPAASINLTYNQQKTKYWLYENEYQEFNGAIYPGNMDELYSNNPIHGRVNFDGFESSLNTDRSRITKNNFNYVSYDNYTISGQGIGGSLSPQILQQGVLSFGESNLAYDENDYRQLWMGYLYDGNSYDFSKTIDGNSSSDIHFYMDNEISSYLRVKSDGWNLPNNGAYYSDIFYFEPQGRQLDDVFQKDGLTYFGYNGSTSRLKKGRYVETFTNLELQNNPNLLIQPLNFDRNSSDIPTAGIGGFKVTTLDGKVYHYSLPVYQKERFSKRSSLDQYENNAFHQNFELEPYATHWLLTAITGPDYIDANQNNIPDESDYGYWVLFDYGKWSDGFIWRSPGAGYVKTKRDKSYQWGRKELYYLDKVITRTHTALFIKEPRKDNRSVNIPNYRNGNDPIVFKDDKGKSYQVGTDGSSYVIGTLTNHQVTDVATNYGEVKSSFYIDTNPQRSLRLKEIILLKNNSSSANIPKSHSNQPSPLNGGEMFIESSIKFYDYLENYLDGNSEVIHEVEDDEWYGEYFENVIDLGDLAQSPNIYDEAIKVIEFDYSYDLVPGSPNTTSDINGKLTLKNIYSKGKSNVHVVPPYTFKYYNPHTEYNIDNIDDWGYHSLNPRVWSLEEVITPTGGSIFIDYEEDEYHRESAISNFVFDSKFEMKFLGSEAGTKYVSFRNHENNSSNENINFHDYFEVGQESRINVQYVKDPNHNGNERVADIDQMCVVTNVTSSTVTFQLPYQSNQNYERNDILCFEDNWIFYQRYNDVVSNTNHWVGEVNADSCSEVLDDSVRIKIQFFSNKEYINQKGGGLRVSKITVKDELDNSLETSYEYDNPSTGVSSGTVSYAPSRQVTKLVKHIELIPSPTVMYEYVSVYENKISANDFLNKKVYKYNTLEPMVISGEEFTMGPELSLNLNQSSTVSANIDFNSSSIRSSKFELEDRLSNIGILEELSIYNQKNQLLSKTVNNYDYNNDQGLLEETFDLYKYTIDSESYSDKVYNLTSSSIKKYPPILYSTDKFERGYISSSVFSNYRFNSGIVTETEFRDSKGNLLKKKTILASDKYSAMKGKVENPFYKNMLAQVAGSYNFIKDNGGWHPISVGITTWNNEWSYIDYNGTLEPTVTDPADKVWRKHQTFVWDGDVDNRGWLEDYEYSVATGDDGFNWSVGATTQPQPWKKISEITFYDHYSRPIEKIDINGNKSSSKTTDNNSKILLTSNAPYGEAFFTSFEYDNNLGGDYVDQQMLGVDFRTELKSHTGSYSASILPGDDIGLLLRGGSHSGGKYKLSAWVHKSNYSNASVKMGYTGQLEPFNGEKVHAGDWVLMSHYFERTEGESAYSRAVLINSESGVIYVDDIRLHPVESSLTSYVYNEFDELTYIMAPNGLSTKYKYDDGGRLKYIYQETADIGAITGGFKLASRYNYNYMRDLESEDDGMPPTSLVSFTNISSTIGGPTTGTVVGQPGISVTFHYSCSGIGTGIEGKITMGSQATVTVTPNDPNEYIAFGIIPPSGEIDFEVEHLSSSFGGSTKVEIISATYPGYPTDPKILEDTNDFGQ